MQSSQRIDYQPKKRKNILDKQRAKTNLHTIMPIWVDMGVQN